jgi:5-methyltetrahydropteroyltriglutamate--homocysteine methyltransferase
MPQPLHTLLPTSLVGSYPQPDWLVDRDNLRGRFPPRVRAKELWRVDPRFLEEAQDDATIVAIRDQERAGLDIITDGEMRRESYSNRFATALEGIDIDNPGSALDRSGHPNPVPRIAGKIRRKYPVQVRDMEFLRRNTTRMVKMTVPGPFTMSQQAQNDFYRSPAEAAMDYAKAVNEEIKDLFAAGADVVQIDEPYMQARPQAAREYGLAALEAALDGVKGTTAVHICFGYAAIIHARPEGYSFLPEFEQCRVHQVSIETAQSNLDTAILEKLPDKTIVLGVIDLDNLAVETPDVVAARITRAFPHCPPERIIVAPDCGMKYLPREVAYGKMVSMVKGAAMVRDALASARSAVDKSNKRKAAAVPEIRTAARSAAKVKPAKAAAKPAKAAKPAPRPTARAKAKAGKKR